MGLLTESTVVLLTYCIHRLLIRIFVSPFLHQAPSFFVIMMFLTILVDRKIAKKFVVPSTTLALTNARLIDEDSARKEERLQRYKEYKAKKAEKKAAVSKAARKEETTKKVDASADQANNSINSVEQEELLKTPARTTSSNGKIILSLPVLRGNTPDQLRQRRAVKLAADSKGGNRLYGDDDDDSDGEEGGGADFYLYRQPQLNKSLWEKKPRPYR